MSATGEAKRPRALQFVDGPASSVVGWACGSCGTAYTQSNASFEMAKLCCGKAPKADGQARAHVPNVDEARKIALGEYKGAWLHAEGVYFERETLPDVQRDRRERNLEPLSYAWACEPDAADFDLVEAVEEYVEESHDKGLTDEIDQGLLDAAQLLVDEALTAVVSQRIRHDLVVLLPAVEDDAPGGDSP